MSERRAERAAVPRVIIAGRPNAGKSTLFNRMIRRRQAIVDPTAGVTRDHNTALVTRGERVFELTDTGGIEDGTDSDHLAERVHDRSLAALGRADVVIYLLDGKAGLAPADVAVAKRVRAHGVAAVFVVNKVDRPSHEPRLLDFYSLGEAELVAVSAAHGVGIEEIWERVERLLPDSEVATSAEASGEASGSDDGGDAPEAAEDALSSPAASTSAEDAQPPHIALIGRPNVGKSSLLNRLAGFERCLVDERPGTTRDAIDVEIRRGPKRYVVVDTAGLRRPSKIIERLEEQAAASSLNAIGRAQIALLVLDASLGITDQDLRLADLAWRRGRGLIVVVNKSDLAPELAAERCREEIEKRLPQWPPLSVVRTSAVVGTGIKALFRAIDSAVDAYSLRIPTARLNTLIETAVEAHPPPLLQGRTVKIFYATQLDTRPPRIGLFTNRHGALAPTYLRYITKHLRESLDLAGVPVHLTIRERARDARRTVGTATKVASGAPRKATDKPRGKSARKVGSGAPAKPYGKTAPKGPPSASGKGRQKTSSQPRTKASGHTGAKASGRGRGKLARRSGGR